MSSNQLMWPGKGLIPAYDDTDIAKIEMLCEAIMGTKPEDKEIKEVSAIKIGVIPSIWNSIPRIKEIIDDYGLTVQLIVDLQKLGNDVEDVLKKIVETVHMAEIGSVIVFPFAGPAAQRAVQGRCRDLKMQCIVGGELTTPQFLASEGGYIADDAPERILNLAIDEYETVHFVAPGNKPERVKLYRALFDKKLGAGKWTTISPGFKFQGGKIATINEIAGQNWQAVIGRAIFEQTTAIGMRKALLGLAAELNETPTTA